VRLFLILILFFSNLYSKFSNLQLVLFKLALILRRHVLRFLLLVLLFLDFFILSCFAKCELLLLSSKIGCKMILTTYNLSHDLVLAILINKGHDSGFLALQFFN